MFYYFLSFIHLLLCVGLVFFVLLQSNKGLGLSGAFGSFGGSDSVFSTSSSLNVLVKITIVLSVLFVFTSITLTVVQPPNSTGSVVEENVGATNQSLQELIEQGQAQEGQAQGQGQEGGALPQEGEPGEAPVAPMEGN